MLTSFNTLKNFLLDILFPKFCLECGKEGELFCAECVSKIDVYSAPFCPECKMRMPGKPHAHSKNKSSIKKLIAATDYGKVKKAIELFKYKFIYTLDAPLSALLMKSFEKIFVSEENQLLLSEHKIVIVPVPLHKKRFAWRGFNQSELIANKIGECFAIPISKSLARIKNTVPQVELKAEEREKNIEGAFETKDNGEISKKIVLLIDDVYTSGATMNECARVLKDAGAKEVWGVAIAR